MITDSITYINKSNKGVGTVYAIHNEHRTKNNSQYWFNSKGREDIKVNLINSYFFEWEKINDWYFLELTINMQKQKIYDINEIRETHSNAYEKWNDESDKLLLELLHEEKKISELSKIFGRKNGAIASRIKKLEKK